jgi:hypothetical protein
MDFDIDTDEVMQTALNTMTAVAAGSAVAYGIGVLWDWAAGPSEDALKAEARREEEARKQTMARREEERKAAAEAKRDEEERKAVTEAKHTLELKELQLKIAALEKALASVKAPPPASKAARPSSKRAHDALVTVERKAGVAVHS